MLTVREEKINRLIPMAMREANRQTKSKNGIKLTEEAGANWSRIYHAEMDALAIKAKLRVIADHRKIKAYKKKHNIEPPDILKKR